MSTFNFVNNRSQHEQKKYVECSAKYEYSAEHSAHLYYRYTQYLRNIYKMFVDCR